MGPPNEYEELYRDFLAYVWAIVVRERVRDADQADLVQAIWLAIFRDRSNRDPRRPAKPWIGTIARRLVRDWKHLARHRHEVPMTEGTLETPDPAPGPDAGADAQAERRMLEDCIHCLEPAAAELVSMHYLDEIPVADLASHHRLTERAIQLRLKGATDELRRVALRRRMGPKARAALAIMPFNAAVFFAPARGFPEVPPGMADHIWGRLKDEIRRDALRGLGDRQGPSGPPAASRGAGTAAARVAARAATHAVAHVAGGAIAGVLGTLLFLRPSVPAVGFPPFTAVLVMDSAAPPSLAASPIPTGGAPWGDTSDAPVTASSAPVTAMEIVSNAPALEGGDAALTADELLLKEARHALVKGDTGAALAALQLHERRHPMGTAVEIDWNHVRASIATRRQPVTRDR